MGAEITTQVQREFVREDADRGFVRFDTIALTDLPPLKLQAPELADRGIVRFGSASITSKR